MNNECSANFAHNRQLVLKEFIETGDDRLLDFFDLDIFLKKGQSRIISKMERGFRKSTLDSSIVLTRAQEECIEILENDNLFISAPTSFGKTFLALEYINLHKNNLNNIVYIVPTIALMNELFDKISYYFGDEFDVLLNDFEISEEKTKKIFIFVPERTLGQRFSLFIKNNIIDLLIYDEIYKLAKQNSGSLRSKDNRIVTMNYIYLELTKKASKILLLGPFIKKINFESINHPNFKQYISNYSPVFNEVNYQPDYKWYEDNSKEKKLIYANNPEEITKEIIEKYSLISYETMVDDRIMAAIEWIHENVYEKWYYSDLLIKGIGIHHGKTPIFLRRFVEQEYRDGKYINTLFCTSTLMEGINTPTEKLIILENPKTIFQFNNLVGRVGRLNIEKPIIGNIICLKNIDNIAYLNSDNWEEITLLVDSKEDAMDEDEYLYLNKIEQSKKYSDYLNYINTLSVIYHINLDMLKDYGMRFSIVKKIIDLDIILKIKSVLSENSKLDSRMILNLISVFRKCIPISPALLNKFSADYYQNIKYKDEYLPITVPIKILIEQHSVKNVISYFVTNFSDNSINVNKYIDAIFELEKYITFDFSLVIPLIDLFKNSFTKEEFNKLNKFKSKIIEYTGSDQQFRKVLLDLGFPLNDCDLIERLFRESGVEIQNKSSHIINNISILSKSDKYNYLSPFSKERIKYYITNSYK